MALRTLMLELNEGIPMDYNIGIVGGTGPLGRGLAARWAAAGIAVRMGSRDGEKADRIASNLAAEIGGEAHITGFSNEALVDADLIVVTLPFSSLEVTLPPLASAFRGKVVISAVNPLAFDDSGPYSQTVPEGSAAERCAKLLPGARIVGAFHSVSAVSLLRLAQPMDDDVPVVGDDDDAVKQTVSLAERIEGVRAFPAGALRLAAPLESLTPVLISVNKLHRSHVGMRLSRLDI